MLWRPEIRPSGPYDTNRLQRESYYGEPGAFSYSSQACALRVRGHLIMKSHACKITNLKTGTTKSDEKKIIRIRGTDLFSGEKLEYILPAETAVKVPVVNIYKYRVLMLREYGALTLGDPMGGSRPDVNVRGEELKAERDTIYEWMMKNGDVRLELLNVMGRERIIKITATLDSGEELEREFRPNVSKLTRTPKEE
ncbi:hypothetical protein K402DRAFT_466784 [Aulographum hederae CBS 113979]|uniref:Translation initiation factor 5A-like N-terminal domain-containing protein n=1 Tax=Aulographum hederae CBS 113979 TaxID=1176131 RepID=A0A6G1GNJ3_9PEZI|nr:hypothetical protein K402DRAFT_466784 [Aulographum hederae CBS 113979]